MKEVTNTCHSFVILINVDYFFLGIKAVTPSAFNTPCGVNSFTPTATPCNSPDCSPTRTRSSSPEIYEALSLPRLLLNSMPQFLQETVGGGAKKKIIPQRRKEKGKEKQVRNIVTERRAFSYW